VIRSKKLTQGLDNLKADYRDKLPDKLATLTEKWTEIRIHGWLEEWARTIHNICHHLAGTGHTFGFSGITSYARIVETQLTQLLDGGGVPSPVQLEKLGQAINNLLVDGLVVEKDAKPCAS
jgi:hypothetical protein